MLKECCMKKVLVLFVMFCVFAWGSTTTVIKSGWQSVGLNNDVTDMSIFTAQNVEEVWIYDGARQRWSGYSPNSQTLAKIEAKFNTISTIGKWQGIWIKSSQEWYLTQEDPIKSDTPIDTIELKKGWNLIAIPLNSTLSPKVFDDNETLIWKYSNEEWQLFDKEPTQHFQPIQSIKKSDGLWVKAQKDRSIELSKESATLQSFASQEEMKAYIETLLVVNNSYPILYSMTMTDSMVSNQVDSIFINTSAPTSAPQEGSTGNKEATNVTNTNLQEKGVDESNTLKSDNQYIYTLNTNTNAIEIYSFAHLATNNQAPVSKIDLNNNSYKNIDSFYLYNNSLVVLSHQYEKSTQVVVDVYDLNDINNITKTQSFNVDGYMSTSRILNNRLIVVSSFSPYADIEYPIVYLDGMEECQNDGGVSYPSMPIPDMPTEGGDTVTSNTLATDMLYPYYYNPKCHNVAFDSNGKAFRYDYDNPIVTQKYLVPQLSYNDFSGDLLNYQSFYAPLKQNQTSTITSVSTFDLDKVEFIKSSAIVGNSHIVYASTSSLYILSHEYPIYYNYDEYQERSVIYKFDIEQDLGFEAMGFVNGFALNQFSLSEYNQTLRVATTQGNSWENNTQNSIFTLKQNGYDLDTLGFLGSLGKEGETIQSVRFVGNKGFVVTFRQTDPLYTLDLSNPANPLKVGELSIDGFSQYIHLVDENRLLTIGRDANSEGVQQGIMIELFDISDFANPKLADKLTIGDNSYYSEALTNHKAFIYRESDKLFGFDYNSWNSYDMSYFGLHQVDGITLKSIAKLSTTNEGYNKCSWSSRGIVFDYETSSYVAYFCNGTVATQRLATTK